MSSPTRYVGVPAIVASIVAFPRLHSGVRFTWNTWLQSSTAELDNLALACWFCNLKKGPNLAGIDPDADRTRRGTSPRNE